MVGRVIANDIDHRYNGFPGIVKIGEAITQATPQMQ
jgi:hypothetical protein